MINKAGVTTAQSGIGLIEVLIALVVFALGVVAMAGLQLATISMTLDSTQRTYVISKSQDIADRIRSNGIPASTYLTGTNEYNEQFCAENEGVLTSCSGNTAGCAADDMALYDLYDAFCVGDGSLNRQVTEWNMDISCAYPDSATSGGMASTTSCDEEGATVTLTTTWFARTAIDDTDSTGADTTETDSMSLSFVP